MNVLFVLYGGLDSNSALHVHHFANHLSAIGSEVVVAVPDSLEGLELLGTRCYGAIRFDESTALSAFRAGRPADIVHAWTPRENVRRFCELVRARHGAALVVHLEDNEEYLVEKMLGVPFDRLLADPHAAIPDNLSHPRRYREFIQAADGVTAIVGTLFEFVPAAAPKLVLSPGADLERFSPRPPDAGFAAKIGVRPGSAVIAYAGNVHPGNAREMRSLYLAIALLNRRGRSAVLVRAGRDFCPFLGEDESWARRYSIELGHLPNAMIPELLALADVLVQPGRPDRFNSYRLPSKLPEYLAMGRPVVVPHANLGERLRHGHEALVYPVVDALQIVEAVLLLDSDPALRRRLGEAAVSFARRELSWRRNAERLADFYGHVLAERGQRAVAEPAV
jgi:glycosyltransferase involved in cell wall biosynthesis